MEIRCSRFFQVRCQGAKKYKHALHRLKAFLMDFTTQALPFKNGDIHILIFKENSTFFDFLRASGDQSRAEFVFSKVKLSLVNARESVGVEIGPQHLRARGAIFGPHSQNATLDNASTLFRNVSCSHTTPLEERTHPRAC
jgi:hypothetical protein